MKLKNKAKRTEVENIEIDEELEETLDEQFPKGKCKERGQALVLFAKANIKINDLKKQHQEYKKLKKIENYQNMNIYKIEYYWHEGEHEETFLAKDVSEKEFEKDIIQARGFAESLIGQEVEYDYLGKGYSVECLPQYYAQIIWFLINKLGYIDCLIDSDISYQIEDYENKIIIQKSKKKIETKEL